MINNNLQRFREQLDSEDISQWLEGILPDIEHRLRPQSQRNFPGWLAALDAIPEQTNPRVELQSDTIKVYGNHGDNNPDLLRALKQLRPWRKGPFYFNDIFIDTEWRCDWKWQRLSPHIDVSGLNILDVGCGNGYYSLRMLGAGARCVVGMDTSLLYWSQFQAITRFTQDHRATLVPLRVEILQDNPCAFDAIFSMGVLYHRRQPLEHLQLMYDNLRPGGKIVLETLIVHGHKAQALIPKDRYANMRNVWTLPTLPLLLDQLEASGFSSPRCVNVVRTTINEQRRTDWMTFNSLAEALDAQDPTLSKEGYPGPIRAIVIADK